MSSKDVSENTFSPGWAERELSKKLLRSLREERAWGSLALENRQLLDLHQPGWYDAWEFAKVDTAEANARRSAIIQGVVPYAYLCHTTLGESTVELHFRGNSPKLAHDIDVLEFDLVGTDNEMRFILSAAMSELFQHDHEHDEMLEGADGLEFFDIDLTGNTEEMQEMVERIVREMASSRRDGDDSDSSNESTDTIDVITATVPPKFIALRNLMPASWLGPSGTAKSRTLVRAMNNARRDGIPVSRLETVTFTPAELEQWKSEGFETEEIAAIWARFGFIPEQARNWDDNRINSHDAYNYARLGATPFDVTTAIRNYPSRNAPTDMLINAYLASRREFVDKMPAGTADDKINEMNDKWGDWLVEKAVPLDAAGYSYKEANYAYQAGQSGTVESIMEFANRQRRLYNETDIVLIRGEGQFTTDIHSKNLSGNEWAEYFLPLSAELFPESEPNA